jgi:DNA-binding transcriptional LysR family regulator
MVLLHALGTIVRAVETGSFTAVARETNSNSASVTRLLRQLEAHYGMRMLHRRTRRLRLTDDGECPLVQARGITEAAEDIEAALGRRKTAPTGRVRVGPPPGMAILVTSRLSTWLRHFPGLSVELVIGELFGDLVEARLDLVVRNGRPENGSSVACAIATVGRAPVAAPAYLEQRGVPLNPAQHDYIVHRTGQ